MRFLKQFTIIIFLSFLGELLHFFLPLPIPASVYGLILMLTTLKLNLIKVSQVKEAAQFLIEIMPVMFIPAGVGLMTSWDALKPVWIPVLIITVVTTVIVMAVTGAVTQAMIRRGKRGQERIQEGAK